MRLVLLSHLASVRSPTGAERSLTLLAERLARRGHRVGVAAPGRWSLAAELERAGVEVATIRVRSCWLAQADRRALAPQLLRLLRCLAPDPGRARLRSWLAARDPEVVLVNCLPHLHGAAAARAVGAPVVWHLREIVPPGWRCRFWARRLARGADRIVAVSEAVASWLRDAGLGRLTEVVLNGVDPPPELPGRGQARARLGLPEDGVVVAWLGQLVRHKGARELVRAAAAAREHGPFVVALAGDGRPRDLAEIRREAEGREWVRLLAPQPGPWELLAAADLVACTSLTPDPLPRVVMEAMAAARPVVAFATGGIPEMVEHGQTGLLVDPGDRAGLGEALAALVADPDRRRQMGAAAGERASRDFSLDRHVARMEAVLAEVAVRGRARAVRREGDRQ